MLVAFVHQIIDYGGSLQQLFSMKLNKESLKDTYTNALKAIYLAVTVPLRIAKLRPEFYEEPEEQEKLINSLTAILITTWDSLNEEEKDYYIDITSSFLEAVSPHFKGVKGFILRIKLLTISLAKNTDFVGHFLNLTLIIGRTISTSKKQDKLNKN